MLVKLKLHDLVVHNNPHLALVIEEISDKHQKEDHSITALDVSFVLQLAMMFLVFRSK